MYIYIYICIYIYIYIYFLENRLEDITKAGDFLIRIGDIQIKDYTNYTQGHFIRAYKKHEHYLLSNTRYLQNTKIYQT